jgi:thymidylate synthase (FAD)
MKVELISYSNLGEKVCGIASKTCVSENIPGVDDDVSKSLKSAMSSGHTAVLEHWSATFAISGVSRALTHQLVRHRMASFSQQSQRYVNMGNFEYVIPESIRNHEITWDEEGKTDVARWYTNVMEGLSGFYATLIEAGIPEEDARYILPNACTTNIVVTMNARELRHFFRLRCCTRAQWEIRELANRMLELCKEVAPVIFENAGASCVQLGYCPEGKKSCGKVKKSQMEE